jgi:hypothetical protein
MRNAAFRGFDSAWIRERDQPDTIVQRSRVFGETRSEVGEVTESIEVSGAQRARTTDVDRNDDLEMLIFREVATDETSAACGRLPVDQMLRVADPIVPQLQHLAAGPGDDARLRSCSDGAQVRRVVAEQLRHYLQTKIRREARRPPRKPERAGDARPHTRPRMLTQATRGDPQVSVHVLRSLCDQHLHRGIHLHNRRRIRRKLDEGVAMQSMREL